MALRTDFSQNWRLRLVDPEDPRVPAVVRDALPIETSVPGTVHTDLLTAGLIPDPYLDRNEEQLTWIGWVDWLYEKEFDHDLDGEERVDLLFEGLDTVATIALNGATLARIENMHRRYEVPLGSALRDGRNLLTVRFDSPRAFGEAERARIGDLPAQYPGLFNFMRKSACNFGWDWGPDLASAGIWRPVTLIRSRTPRIREVRPVVTVTDGRGRAALEVEFDRPLEDSARLTAAVGCERAGIELHSGVSAATIVVEVEHPRLWWPRGHGEPTLYQATVTLQTAEEDSWTGRLGFRSVELDTAADDDGSRFRLVINGVPVPVRGANWIPDDCFFPRVTSERVRTRIAQAVEANVNLLRVWGGGTYESRDFYDRCDEQGVLVWQDFLFACAAYPEEERLAREVEAEARDNVARLMPHPSLVLWNGNNENIWGYLDWDWQARVGDRAWGLGYYLDVLPRVLAAVDPSRPYWPGTPYSGSPALHPNDEDHGTSHIWDVWNEVDYTVYREHRPRFAAEFGWQAPPTWSTLTRAIHDEPLAPDSPATLAHQKANDGAAKLERGILRHLPEPTGIDDWLYATQLTQARAVRVGVEHFRALRPRCWGTVVWQLNDCWPAISWAAIDGDGRKKPLWYALRSAYAPVLLTVQPHADGLEAAIVNDTPDDWHGVVTVRRLSFDGDVLAQVEQELRAEPTGRAGFVLPNAVARPADHCRELLVASTDGLRSDWFFTDELRLDLPVPRCDILWERDRDDAVATITAQTLLRDLCLFPDRIVPGAEADDALLTLLPGETRRIRVTGIPAGRERELDNWPLAQSAGGLVHRARSAAKLT